MRNKFIPIALISSLFAISTLTGCSKDEIAGVKNGLQEQIDEINQQIEDLKNEITALRGEMDESISEVSAEFTKKINEINGQIDELETQLNQLKAQHEKDKGEIIADYNNKLDDLQNSYDTHIGSLQDEINTNKAAIESLTAKHNEDKAALEADYNQKINALAASEVEARVALKTELENSLNELDQEYSANMALLQQAISTNSDAITTLTTKHNEDKAELIQDYTNKINALEASELEARNALKLELEQQLAELQEDYEKTVAELQSAISANKDAINLLSNKLTKDLAAVIADYTKQIKDLGEDEQEAREKLEKELNEQIEALEAEFALQIDALQSAINANTDAITNLVNKHNQDKAAIEADYNEKINNLEEDELEARNALKEALEAEIASLEASFAESVLNLQTQITSNLTAITALTQLHNKDIADLTSDYNSKITALAESEKDARDALQLEFNTALSDLNQSFETTVQNLQSAIDGNTELINDLTEQFESDKAALKEDYEAKIAALDAKYAEETAKIYNQISTLQTSITSLTNEMNQQISDIQADYNSKINELTGRVVTLEEVEYHTVTFEAEGATIPSQIIKHGEKATRPVVPECPGYYYDTDWYIYNEDETLAEPWYFYSATVTEDITLHLIRYPESYEIRLNENCPGGSIYMKDGLVYSGEEFTCPVPTYAEHDFLGWYYGETQVTDETGKSLSTYEFAGDITLLAHWSETHDGSSAATAFTVDEVLNYMSSYSVGDWSDREIYVTGTFASGTTYNSQHSSFSGYTVGHDLSSEKIFQIFSAVLDSSIENKYGANGCLDGATFIVRGYLNLYSDGSVVKYEVAYDKDKSNPVIEYLEGATEKVNDGIEYIKGENATNCVVTVNGFDYEGIKVGTAKLAGNMYIQVPEDTRRITFYAAAWNGKTAEVSISAENADVDITSITLNANAGISGNSPFTLQGDSDIHLYEVNFSNVTGDISLKLETTDTTNGRFVVWGATTYLAPTTRGITIYLGGLETWTNVSEVDFALDGVWGIASKLSNGKYKYKFETNDDASTLNCKFVTDSYSRECHPTTGLEDYDTTNSAINLGDLELKAGNSYVITYTDWHYSTDNFAHRWFYYSFTQL